MPVAGVSFTLPPCNQSDYSGMGVAWKTASSEVTVKVVVSLWKRCTQPEGSIQLSNSEVRVLGFQGRKVFVIALSKLRTAVNSATNTTRLNLPTYRAHLFCFNNGPLPMECYSANTCWQVLLPCGLHSLYPCVMCCWSDAGVSGQGPLD